MSAVQGTNNQPIAASNGSEKGSFGEAQSSGFSMKVVTREALENHRQQFLEGQPVRTLRIGVDAISSIGIRKAERETDSDSSGSVENFLPRLPSTHKRSREELEADLLASGLGPSPKEIAKNQKKARALIAAVPRRTVSNRVHSCAARALRGFVFVSRGPYQTPFRLLELPNRCPRRSLEDLTRELMALPLDETSASANAGPFLS